CFKRSNGYKILSFQTYKAVCLIPQVYRVSRKSTKSNRFISGGSANKKGCIPLGISLLVCGPAWA
ncbi:hypothetical protein, partial [Phocaeicola vulgatus]|uniref:hypothetical protein n=1 Tax=Phocaeicola vulgatus TaxID=821 RepID=UPI001C88D670